jgi:hypothetical protein
MYVNEIPGSERGSEPAPTLTQPRRKRSSWGILRIICGVVLLECSFFLCLIPTVFIYAVKGARWDFATVMAAILTGVVFLAGFLLIFSAHWKQLTPAAIMLACSVVAIYLFAFLVCLAR